MEPSLMMEIIISVKKAYEQQCEIYGVDEVEKNWKSFYKNRYYELVREHPDKSFPEHFLMAQLEFYGLNK